jgi:two-component system chemotaxis response regulator CheY
MSTAAQRRILIAGQSRHGRGMMCDVLRAAGYHDLLQAADSEELLRLMQEQRPQIVVLPALCPEMSGLEFVQRVRRGLNFVPRETAIILTVEAPTRAFLDSAQAIGVDEIVALPFTPKSLLVRIGSVIERPRPFVDCPAYVGPCRRRRMLQDYRGARRRAADVERSDPPGLLWASESNRAAVRLCVQKISESGIPIADDDRRKLRELYQSVMQEETRARQMSDEALGEAARSCGRYLEALGPQIREVVDLEVVCTHINAMHTLAKLAGGEGEAHLRSQVIAGLQRVVEKKMVHAPRVDG